MDHEYLAADPTEKSESSKNKKKRKRKQIPVEGNEKYENMTMAQK